MEPIVEKSFDPALARALVRRAAELGINCFDTAEVYGFGRARRRAREPPRRTTAGSRRRGRAVGLGVVERLETGCRCS
jgi:hypothetical protein